jgi:hypothetical protein
MLSIASFKLRAPRRCSRALALLLRPFLLCLGYSISYFRPTASLHAVATRQKGPAGPPTIDDAPQELVRNDPVGRFATDTASCEGSAVTSIFGAICKGGREWASNNPVSARRPEFYYERYMPRHRVRGSL